MHLGILQCDDAVPVLHDTPDYPDMFMTLLRQADPNLRFSVWRCHENTLPTGVNDADGWLITGSRAGVNDDRPWIEPLAHFVRTLWQAQRPVAGICFGHQLIAHALGGQVTRNPQGWGVGVARYAPLAPEQAPAAPHRHHWMQPALPEMHLIVSHQDHVDRLPPEATRLAGNDFCPNFMFEAGGCFLGIQGHPEFPADYAAGLMNARRGIIPDDRIEAGLASLKGPINGDTVARWIVQFLRQAQGRSKAPAASPGNDCTTSAAA
ncbi:MAG: GMP synthase [Alcaligenaceae bacterium]|nr:GMP synthase [Alcaligenaceae bacterium]